MTVTPSSELGTVEVPLEALAGSDAAADLDLAIFFVTGNEPFKKIESELFRR